MTNTQTKTQRLIAEAGMLTAEQPQFKAGDLIVWKSLCLQNKAIPDVAEPAVVTRILLTPVTDSRAAAGTSYFNEQLDIAAAVIDGDGDFLEYHFDSRRFRLATQEEIDAWDAKEAQSK